MTMIDWALHKAIEQLYEVFSRYPLRKMNGCDHCVFPEDHARMQSKPLRQLTHDDLSKFAHKAMTTWGDSDDFKHFLPRLYEVITFDSGWPVSPERLMGSKMPDAGWPEWPADEVEAVRSYLMALWRELLRRPEQPLMRDGVPIAAGPAITEYLQSLIELGEDVEPYLREWSEACRESAAARQNLAEFVHWVVLSSGQERQPSPNGEARGGYEKVALWLADLATEESLLYEADEPQDPDYKQVVDMALQELEWLQTLPYPAANF